MSDTKLPRTLPAGTVVFVPIGERRRTNPGEWYVNDWDKIYICDINNLLAMPVNILTRHVLTAPLHILDDGMVEAVRDAREELQCEADRIARGYVPMRGGGIGSCVAESIKHINAAFAHVINPPQETVKEVPKTLVERAMALRSPDGSLNPTVQWNDSVLLDALSVIDTLRAELKEVRNGR